MKTVVVLALVLAVALGGCAGMTPTQQRMLSGGAIGAGAGSIIGWAAGAPAAGAAIGGGAGVLGGYLYDQFKKSR
jgi:hypothetical protein